MPKVILDLCGGSGNWSRPYAEAGYDVRLITLPDYDVMKYSPPASVYGILAAPDCTHFAGSGAQYWPSKDLDGRTAAALTILDACMLIITVSEPVFWCLENPVGRIPRLRPLIGPPLVYFHPYEYGDAYTKKTGLWGVFNMPARRPVQPVRSCDQGSWIQRLGGRSERTKYLRSITPPGFARAFFEANQ